jgi:hypothetical protein
MAEVEQSKLSPWMDHANELLWAHARIYRGDDGLKANKAAYVYRVAIRGQSHWIEDIARSMHLARDPSYDPAAKPAARIDPRELRPEGLFPGHEFVALFVAPFFIGAYGAARLIREGLSDRSLRKELIELRQEINEQQERYYEVRGKERNDEDHFAAMVDFDLKWLDSRIDWLQGNEKSSYYLAATIAAWNVVGGLALVSAFCPLPKRWFGTAFFSAAFASGIGMLSEAYTALSNCIPNCGEEEHDRPMFDESHTASLQPWLQNSLGTLDPALKTDGQLFSDFGRAITAYRAMSTKIDREGEKLSLSKPPIWQEPSDDYWGLPQLEEL